MWSVVRAVVYFIFNLPAGVGHATIKHVKLPLDLGMLREVRYIIRG
ncbi:hypothetical protein cpu_20910 [Carboxydothermus pertinax]|uniref:Uncharacterized protein n=1 Tax=Carboxydothermus pertinax TaxID=870242 RepID=A0A1L8CXI0_9THEO|nr:hypothetical protein cpu_20910 [Carboxydothermus pertinax]